MPANEPTNLLLMEHRRYDISMNTTSLASPTLLDELKSDLSVPPTLFADIVFDRPLDHAYTYLVPAALHSAIGVGRRVEVPFGRGDKATVGYCIGVHDVAPNRPVKDIFRVLDAESLLTDSLLRLTRWMAD